MINIYKRLYLIKLRILLCLDKYLFRERKYNNIIEREYNDILKRDALKIYTK